MSRTIASTLSSGISLVSSDNPVTITSTGRITDSSSNGIYGGRLPAGWTISNSGTIVESNGTGFGVYLESSATLDAFTNQTGGLITSAHNGLGMKEAGLVINQANATITSTDSGLSSAIYIEGSGTIVNAGLVHAANTAIYEPGGGFVTNLASGTISGVSGVYMGAAGTVINAGTIIGTDPVYGAVWFKSSGGRSRLIVDPGAVFSGKIVSHSGSNNVLELASGASAGTLSGFDGTSITNFATLQFDSGAAWTVTGNSAASGLGSIAITGFTAGDTIDLMGFVATSKTFASNLLVLTNASNAHATLHIQGSFSSGSFSMTSDGGTGTDVFLGTTAAAALVYGQTIDKAGIVAAFETVAAGVMTLFSGGGTAVGTVQVGTSLTSGDFILRSDGSGGTDVIVSSVFGTYTNGVTLLTNPTTIAATGKVTGSVGTYFTSAPGGDGGIGVHLSSGSLTNAGAITGGTGSDSAVQGGVGGVGVAVSGGSLTNQATIRGGAGGPGDAYGGPGVGGYAVVLTNGTVTNRGTITGGVGAGSRYGYSNGGGGVTVSGGSLINTTLATIIGGRGADAGYGPGGAGGAGVAVTAGRVANQGRIIGGAGGSVVVGYHDDGGNGVNLAGGVFTNQGTIIGGNGQQGGNAGSGPGLGGSGVNLTGGTLIDAGVITGGTGTRVGGATFLADAVHFSGAARLILDPAASFVGTVAANAAFTDVLELASAATTGTIAGFGTSITNFSSLVFDPGAQWTVAGNASASGLGTLAISGFTVGDTIDLTGFAAVSRTFASNSLVLTDTLGAHATLAVQGSFRSGNFLIASDGSGGTNITEQTALSYGDTVQESGIVAASETVAAGMMTLFNAGGTAVGTVTVGTSLTSADFILTSDGSGGTDVIVSTVFGSYTSGIALTVNPTTIAGTAHVIGIIGSYGIIAAGGDGGIGASLPSGGLTNAGVLTGGAGGASTYQGGVGGMGLAVSGGTLINIAHGTIAGGVGGVGTGITHAIGGAGGVGAMLLGGSVTNAALATIIGGAGGRDTYQTGGGGGSRIAGSGGVGLDITAGSLANQGTVTGGAGGNSQYGTAGVGGAGIAISGASLTNQGQITGGNGGRSQYGTAAAGGVGIAISGASLTNQGQIAGGDGGYSNYSNSGAGGAGASVNAGRLTNAAQGTIAGGNGNGRGAGIGGDGVDAVGSTIINQGTIIGGAGGYGLSHGDHGGDGVKLNGGVITNQGMITGGNGGPGQDGGGPGGYGVDVLAGTLVNAGLIAGGTESTFPFLTSATAGAVHFSGAGRLVVDPGASFRGAVVANATVSDVLELAAGGGAGTLTGLGTTITNFTSLVFDPGAQWTVAGNGSASGLGTLSIIGFGVGDTIDLTGFAAVSGTFASNSLVLTDTLGAHATLAVQGAFVSSNFLIASDGSGGTNITEQPELSYGDTVQESGIVAASETVSAGMMTLFDGGGTLVGTISVGTSLSTGDFLLKPDGSGGTDVIVSTVFGTYTSGVTLLTNPTTIAATGTVSTTLANGGAIFGPSGTDWTLVNRGLVSETGTNGTGISLVQSGTVANAAGGTIDAASDAIRLAGGGFVSNQSGGTITGLFGIRGDSATTVVNAGSIGGNASVGGIGVVVFSGGSGTVTNLSGGVITGAYGVALTGQATLVNAGTITGTQAAGFYGGGGGLVTNQSGGLITGFFGVWEAVDALTVQNAGSIGGNATAAGAAGVYLGAGGTVTNQSGGTITGYDGVKMTGGVGSVANAGLIAINYNSGGGYAVDLAAGGSVTNQSGGTIRGHSGVGISGAPGTVSNQGSILTAYVPDAARGVYLSNGGEVINGAPGGTASSALIAAYDRAVLFGATGTGTLVNYGVIAGQNGGVTMQSAGTVINGASGATGARISAGGGTAIQINGSGTVVNYGTISNYGLPIGGTIVGTIAVGRNRYYGVLLSSGGIVNNLGAHALIQGYVGVYGKDGATVTNAGTIGSSFNGGVGNGAYPSPLAVQFGTGTNRLIIDPGAVFVGKVTAAGTTTLELASAATVGTLSGLGVKYSSFSAVMVDAGARWIFGGSNTLTSGITLDNVGLITGATEGVILGTGGVISNQSGGVISATASNAIAVAGSGAGTLVNAGDIEASSVDGLGISLASGGSVTNQSGGTISGAHAILAQSGALTVVNAGSIVGGGGIASGVALGGSGTVSNQSGGVITGNYAVAAYASGATITNAGDILGVYGVLLIGAGSLFNQASGTISGSGEGVLAFAAATVVNAGTITGVGYGVQLTGGGTVIAQSGGTISATGAAVSFGAGHTNRLVVQPNATFVGSVDGGNTLGGTSISTLELASAASTGTFAGLGTQFVNFAQVTVDVNARWSFSGPSTLAAHATLTNAGTILLDETGGLLLAGGYALNQVGGLITNSASAAIYGAPGTSSSVVNLGTLDGEFVQGYGVQLAGGGSVINGASTVTSALITASVDGILISGAAGTVINAGSIKAHGGVYLQAGGSVTNQATGTITGYYAVTASSAAVTVVNAGSIGGQATIGFGIRASAGGTITNQAGGAISGYEAIRMDAVAGTVVNAGIIIGLASAGGYGVVLAAGGYISNLSGGTIAGAQAVVGRSAPLTLINAGNIGGDPASGTGIYAKSGGTLSNQAGGTIRGYIGIAAETAISVANAGIITGGTISGIGIFLAAGGTVAALTGGTISGGAAAVEFGGGYANRLAVDPGAIFSGTVDGGNTIGATVVSTLELRSGASTGTLTGLGSQFINFAQTTIDTGANWTFYATNAVVAGSTLTNSGTLTDTGTLFNSGTLTGNRFSLDGGLLSNAASGVIAATDIYSAATADISVVINQGSIINTLIAPIYLSGPGGVLNAAGGVITGSSDALKLGGALAIVLNLGTINTTTTTSGRGVYLQNGGTVANGQSGTATSDALIQGYDGVKFRNGTGVLSNYGTIIGTGGLGVSARTSGSLVNGASGATSALVQGTNGGVDLNSGSVTNYATIIGVSTVGYAWGVGIGNAGTVSNLGTASLIQGYGGVYVGDDSTVINAGRIESNQGTSGVAVHFAGGNARLVDNPGAVFIGTVYGGSGGSAVLELASAASAGTITGIGASITNFTSLVFDNGAHWLVSGNDSAAGLGTMGISGFTVGDTIDLTGFQAASTTFSSNRLVLGDGVGNFATLAIQGGFLSGNFQIASDGTGGTDITFQDLVSPVIGGTSGAQTVNDNATLQPFAGVTVGDANAGNPTETVTIAITNGGTLTDANGTLSGTGLTRTGTGTYQLADGTAAAVTAELDALVFTPVAHEVAPGGTIVTGMTLSVLDSLGQSASDTATSVVATAMNTVPVISGTVAGQSVNDDATLQPFSAVNVTDPDLGSSETVTIVLTAGGAASDAGGGLSGTGLTKTGIGTYVLAAGTPGVVGSALDALIFTPTAHQAVPGGTITTGMTLSVTDGIVGSPAVDTATSVVATAVNTVPVISGTVAGQSVNDDATLQPFSAVGVTDPDFGASETVTLVLTVGGAASDADGGLSGTGLTKTGTGTYVLATGTPGVVGLALDALVFTPAAHQEAPGGTITTGITLSVTDGIMGSPAVDTATSVVATAVNTVPVISGTAAGQSVNDDATLQPFSAVGVTDPDLGASETVTIVLTAGGAASDAGGGLSGTGLTKTGIGTYVLAAGTPGAVDSALDALVFTPTAHQVAPGGTITTGITLSVTNGIIGSPAVDTATSVVATAVNTVPVINGTVAGQIVAETSATRPFAGVVVADPDAGASATITIVVTGDGGGATDADGALSGTGLSKTGTGTYALAAGTPDLISSELEDLRFTPAPNVLRQNGTVTTGMTLSVSDGIVGSPVTDTSTTLEIVPCFAAGTRLATPRGHVAVERLREGDMLMTVSGRFRPIQWIGRRSVDCNRHVAPERVKPIRIAPHAFGENRPSRALRLSPDHSVFVEDVLIPIKFLVNGSTVAQVDVETVTYYHVELPGHDVVLADGLPTETYLETGGRFAFENGGGAMQLHPDFAPDEARVAMVWQNFGYAPLIGTDGQVERVRGRLACQALMLAHEGADVVRSKKPRRQAATR